MGRFHSKRSPLATWQELQRDCVCHSEGRRCEEETPGLVYTRNDPALAAAAVVHLLGAGEPMRSGPYGPRHGWRVRPRGEDTQALERR